MHVRAPLCFVPLGSYILNDISFSVRYRKGMHLLPLLRSKSSKAGECLSHPHEPIPIVNMPPNWLLSFQSYVNAQPRAMYSLRSLMSSVELIKFASNPLDYEIHNCTISFIWRECKYTP